MTTCQSCGSDLTSTSYEWIDGVRYCWGDCLGDAVESSAPTGQHDAGYGLRYLAGLERLAYAISGDEADRQSYIKYEQMASMVCR